MVLIKALLITLGIFTIANSALGQVYNQEKVCGTDTIRVNYIDAKMGDTVNYKAFHCSQVLRTGFRVEIGRASFTYYGGTKTWLGNHGAGLVGLAYVNRHWNLGVKFKLATTHPKRELVFNGDTLTTKADLNPPKIDLYLGYSFDFKQNISVEPYIGLTRNLFYVINENELKKTFVFPKIHGLNIGVTINKYFTIKGFQFLSGFFTYGYGFSNYRKVHPSLDRGYSEWAVGISYKLFAKREIDEKIN
jgi:hypothetical protein